MFVSYAQNFEDVMLWRALKHVERGCYIDVGAWHPRVDSVSRAFYERGWRGVHVEPVPHYAALLREDRPDELVLEVAVAELAGTRALHLLSGTGLSTFDAALAARHEREGGYARQEVVVPVLTLDSVFEAAGQAQFHWLKIDVEGAERAVLQGWDKARFRPWIVLVEATIPMTQTDDSAHWEALILEGGYEFVYFDGLNRWYVRNESPDLARAFQVPPNCFDGFVGAREIETVRERDELAGQLTAARNELAAQQQTLGERQARLETQIEECHLELDRLRSELAVREQQLRDQYAERERELVEKLAACQKERS